MENTHLYLFIIKNPINKKESDNMERVIKNTLYFYDFNYLAFTNDGYSEIFTCCFDLDRIKLLEKNLKEINVLVSCDDITQSTMNFKNCQELEMIINSSKENRKIIEEFITKNLDADKILDKICDIGIDSLKDIEMKFLESC